MREVWQFTKYINPDNRKNDGRQKDGRISAGSWEDGEEEKYEDRGNCERGMGNPIVERSVQDISKRTRAFEAEGVHNRLALIVNGYKNDPGETEKKDQAV